MWQNQCFLNRLDRFATLATRLDSLSVTPFSLECHPCHACHIEKEGSMDRNTNGQAFIGKKASFQWLAQVMEEGHLEPSQPLVGKIVGWPQRMISRRSIWIDFCSWCYKQKILSIDRPEEQAFYELLDRIFIPHQDKYEIPPLKDCRKIFETLRVQYECD